MAVSSSTENGTKKLPLVGERGLFESENGENQ
jgi:hypothetical protein